MGFGYVAYAKLVLFILGLLWCKEVIERFHDDVAELRKPKPMAEKAAIVFIWLLTLGVVLVMAVVVTSFLLVLIREW